MNRDCAYIDHNHEFIKNVFDFLQKLDFDCYRDFALMANSDSLFFVAGFVGNGEHAGVFEEVVERGYLLKDLERLATETVLV